MGTTRRGDQMNTVYMCSKHPDRVAKHQAKWALGCAECVAIRHAASQRAAAKAWQYELKCERSLWLREREETDQRVTALQATVSELELQVIEAAQALMHELNAKAKVPQ